MKVTGNLSKKRKIEGDGQFIKEKKECFSVRESKMK